MKSSKSKISWRFCRLAIDRGAFPNEVWRGAGSMLGCPTLSAAAFRIQIYMCANTVYSLCKSYGFEFACIQIAEDCWVYHMPILIVIVL